jgi:hypothetical protein
LIFGTLLGIGLRAREPTDHLVKFDVDHDRLARASVDPLFAREAKRRKLHLRAADRGVATRLHEERECSRLRCRNLASEFELTVRVLCSDVADIWLAVHANRDLRPASLDVAAHNHWSRRSPTGRQEDDCDESRGGQEHAE